MGLNDPNKVSNVCKRCHKYILLYVEHKIERYMKSNFFCHLLCHSMPAYYSTPKRIRWKSKPHEIVCLLSHISGRSQTAFTWGRGYMVKKNQTFVNICLWLTLRSLLSSAQHCFPNGIIVILKSYLNFLKKTVKLRLYDLHHHLWIQLGFTT